jgi:hypothetical protein
MTDNTSSRKVYRDGNFTSLSSYQYQDIKEGTVELTSFTQPGGAGTAITAVTFAAIRGRDYTVSASSITDTDITAFFGGIGVAPAAARSIDLSFVVNFSQNASLNLSSTNATLEIPATAGGAPGVTVNSSTVLVDNVTRNSMTVHVIIEIWGASDAAIYTLLAALFSSDPLPRSNFIAKIAK